VRDEDDCCQASVTLTVSEFRTKDLIEKFFGGSIIDSEDAEFLD